MSSTATSAETPAAPSTPVVKSASPKPPVTFTEILNMIIYTALSIAAVYYGWTYGLQYSLHYWMVIQSFGQRIGKMLWEFIQSFNSTTAVRTGAMRTYRY